MSTPAIQLGHEYDPVLYPYMHGRYKYASRDRTGNNTPDYLEIKFVLQYDILLYTYVLQAVSCTSYFMITI